MHYQLDGFYQYEEDIKKSRFLALAGPIGSAEEAMAFIQTHHVPDATHNCWAYKLGDEYRFNDDGEPGGTAGRPMLQAIEGQDCDRVVVLVIRWCQTRNGRPYACLWWCGRVVLTVST